LVRLDYILYQVRSG